MVGRGVVIVIAALGAALFAPGAASAGISLSNIAAHPTANGATCSASAALDAPAATHRDFCVAFDLDGSETIKNLTLELPPGVVGDPTAVPTCSRTDFQNESCTASSQVGDTTAVITAAGLPLGADGKIYNLTPAAGEPARLGILLDGGAAALSHVRLESPIRVRVADAGLTSQTDGIPNTTVLLVLPIPIHLDHMALRLWGANTDGSGSAIAGRHLLRPFITLPTRCDADAVTHLSVVGWGDGTGSGSARFRPTACDQVPFTPTLEAAPKTAPADTPGEASATIVVPAGDTNGRRQAYVRSVALHLPPGLDINPPLADGLVPCTDEQFGFGVDATPQCPANTEIGTVEFTTPLFPQPLTGKVYFGAPKPGQALRNFVSVEDPRLRLKLLGIGTVDPQTGQVTATFPDSPQVPFTRFEFTYNGGPHGALTSPTTCGQDTVTADMAPWTDTAPTTASDTFDVVDCPPPSFTPTLDATVTTAAAGGPTGLTLTVQRPDRQLRLQRLAVSLPPGLVGRLTAVPACSVADARAAHCADASRIGTATVAVGIGPAPLSLPGRIYLTEGRDGGVAGLAIVVDASLPALDLGTVVTLATIRLRDDGGLDVVSDELPQRVQGFATAYRSIALTIDRAGFLRNATDCSAFAVHGTFTAVGGTIATADAPYAATGCDALPFAPKLSASLGAPGQVGVHGHPPLSVTIEQAPGESAMKRTVVTLPAGIGVDLKNLVAACSADQLGTGTCPAPSRIGTVRAETPLLPTALSGGVYLTESPKGQLPGIALDLGLLRLRGAVAFAKGNRVQTVFDAVPDVPLSRLVLDLTGGPKAVLASSIDLCAAEPTVDAQFTAHSGATGAGSAPARVAGCDPLTASGTLTGIAKRRPTLRVSVASTKPLRQLRVTLPSRLRPASVARLRRGGRLLLGGRRLAGTRFGWFKNRVVVTLPARSSARSLQVTLPRGALRLTRRTRSGTRLSVPVTATAADGEARSVRATVVARA